MPHSTSPGLSVFSRETESRDHLNPCESRYGGYGSGSAGQSAGLVTHQAGGSPDRSLAKEIHRLNAQRKTRRSFDDDLCNQFRSIGLSIFLSERQSIRVRQKILNRPPANHAQVRQIGFATTSAPPPGSVCCNNADAPAENESVAGSPLAGTGGSRGRRVAALRRANCFPKRLLAYYSML
jgi:hypothetical protein